MRPIFTVITDRSVLAFELKPIRSVQSQAQNLIFPLDESLVSSAANNTFRNYDPRDRFRHEVRNR
jgi:hypothetical protein